VIDMRKNIQPCPVAFLAELFDPVRFSLSDVAFRLPKVAYHPTRYKMPVMSE
jgi:hypothetical protein